MGVWGSRVLCAEDERRNDTIDIGGWLRGLGLERYEWAFRENEIDEEVLPGLTADDLKDLGVGVACSMRLPHLAPRRWRPLPRRARSAAWPSPTS